MIIRGRRHKAFTLMDMVVSVSLVTASLAMFTGLLFTMRRVETRRLAEIRLSRSLLALRQDMRELAGKAVDVTLLQGDSEGRGQSVQILLSGGSSEFARVGEKLRRTDAQGESKSAEEYFIGEDFFLEWELELRPAGKLLHCRSGRIKGSAHSQEGGVINSISSAAHPLLEFVVAFPAQSAEKQATSPAAVSPMLLRHIQAISIDALLPRSTDRAGLKSYNVGRGARRML